jgi:hypothetical protein
VGKLVLAGNTSGTTILNGPSAGLGGTVVLPLTGTLATLAGTETLSNKTLTSPTLTNPSIGAAVGTTLVLGGGTPLGTTNQVGTGRIVMDNSPTLITPNIGVATGTSLDLGGGTVTAAQFSGNAATVSAVGGVPAATIANGALAANAATNINTAGEIVRRDASGNFSAGTVTAALNGNATSANFANTSGTATNANNTAITDDLATAATTYPTFVTATSGNNAQRVSSSRLTFVPATGLLTSTNMSASQFTSTVANGTAPFVVNSNTPVVGLNIGGNAGTATLLQTSRSIYGATFNGSADLAGPVIGQFGGTGTNNGTRTISVAGNFATAGGGAITLNSVGASSVTLPASGTLYGTAAGSFNSTSLRTSLTDPTGTGGTVFATNPTMERPIASSLLANPGATYNTSSGSPGTNVTVNTVSGTDLAGTVTITVFGGSTGTNQIISTITYSNPFPVGSFPILYPGNAAAAELGTVLNRQVFAEGSSTGFNIRSTSVAIPAGTYIWNYHVIGR